MPFGPDNVTVTASLSMSPIVIMPDATALFLVSGDPCSSLSPRSRPSSDTTALELI